jgi:hypothetical protein
VHLARFLDKACITNRGNNGAWSVCSATKVEETKSVLGVLPLFLSSIIGYMPDIIVFTFTVQQGGMTDTRLGGIHVSPATLFIIPTAFQMAMLAVYDRFLVPFLRRCTGLAGGVTHLQRVGVGFVSVTLSSVIAAIVEKKRKEDLEKKMSLFWLAPQFLLLGVSDVTSFTGLLEFFNSEAPRGMKSIATHWRSFLRAKLGHGPPRYFVKIIHVYVYWPSPRAPDPNSFSAAVFLDGFVS